MIRLRMCPSMKLLLPGDAVDTTMPRWCLKATYVWPAWSYERVIAVRRPSNLRRFTISELSVNFRSRLISGSETPKENDLVVTDPSVALSRSSKYRNTFSRHLATFSTPCKTLKVILCSAINADSGSLSLLACKSSSRWCQSVESRARGRSAKEGGDLRGCTSTNRSPFTNWSLCVTGVASPNVATRVPTASTCQLPWGLPPRQRKRRSAHNSKVPLHRRPS
mmetsp:Transcript_123965/g.309840  ORF Transcript_123965/g.309840 Transcript_123965/m.309840 type:complete len:222 (+) Transcript_123965:981-1646(+)